jgi:hypothetical protein
MNIAHEGGLVQAKGNNGYYHRGSRPTVCVTCVWAGVDNAWEQGKLEARKILENAARAKRSPTRQVHALLGGVVD